MLKIFNIYGFICLFLSSITFANGLQGSDYHENRDKSEVIEKLNLSKSQMQNIEGSNPEIIHKINDIMAQLEANEIKIKALGNLVPVDKVGILKLTEQSREALFHFNDATSQMLLLIEEELTNSQRLDLAIIRSKYFDSIPKVIRGQTTKILLQSGKEIPVVIQDAKILKSVPPSYTEEARKNQIEGNARLKATVLSDGSVDDIKVVQGLGYGLDEIAIKTIKEEWKFIPRMVDGKPIETPIELDISFRLYRKP